MYVRCRFGPLIARTARNRFGKRARRATLAPKEQAPMFDAAIPPEDFQSLDQLMAKLPKFLAAAPKDPGTLDMIVMRNPNP